jgi:DNA adenine methylase
MGGKSKLRKEIISRLPEHTCYVETFFGAGWVYFGKEPSKVEVINDVEGELVNLFRMMKYHASELQRMLQYELSCRDEFEYYKQADPKGLTEIQRAIRFIYLNSQSFAAKGGNYGYGTSTKPRGIVFGERDLLEIQKRLRNTYVENLDFEELIQKYDRPKSLFFCDPPYYETAGYESDFTLKDQMRLVDCLKGIKGKFLVTINDHPAVREWYSWANIEEVNTVYSISRDKDACGKVKELIITNYEPAQIKMLF